MLLDIDGGYTSDPRPVTAGEGDAVVARFKPDPAPIDIRVTDGRVAVVLFETHGGIGGPNSIRAYDREGMLTWSRERPRQE